MIWNQDQKWGAIHSSELNRGENDSGLSYLASKVNKPGAVGRINALQTLSMITREGALIPEFCAKGVVKSILQALHSSDEAIKLCAADILRSFTKYEKLTTYIDNLDLLRNMIDAFYSSEEGKMVNLILEAFLNLCANPIIRVLFGLILSKLCFPLKSPTRSAGFLPESTSPSARFGTIASNC